jgi:hypothetical protein
MAKKQTRRSISVSRTTYERLKAFCEANNISMSQLVETRVNDFLGEGSVIIPASNPTPMAPRPTMPSAPRPSASIGSSTGSSIGSGSHSPATPPKQETAAPRPSSPVVPMTSAAARFAVDPPPPIIKPKQTDTNAPKPAEKRPDQIFTF